MKKQQKDEINISILNVVGEWLEWLAEIRGEDPGTLASQFLRDYQRIYLQALDDLMRIIGIRIVVGVSKGSDVVKNSIDEYLRIKYLNSKEKWEEYKKVIEEYIDFINDLLSTKAEKPQGKVLDEEEILIKYKEYLTMNNLKAKTISEYIRIAREFLKFVKSNSFDLTKTSEYNNYIQEFLEYYSKEHKNVSKGSLDIYRNHVEKFLKFYSRQQS